jgi:large subunit ribosomal protein L4
VFIGGGKAHGARRREFNPSLNKKVRALGLKMALSAKAQNGLIVVDNLEGVEAKTKALKGEFGKAGLNGKVLVIDGDIVSENFARAAGNLVGVSVLPAVGANVYDILKHDTLVLTRAAVEKLEARFAPTGVAE